MAIHEKKEGRVRTVEPTIRTVRSGIDAAADPILDGLGRLGDGDARLRKKASVQSHMSPRARRKFRRVSAARKNRLYANFKKTSAYRALGRSAFTEGAAGESRPAADVKETPAHVGPKQPAFPKGAAGKGVKGLKSSAAAIGGAASRQTDDTGDFTQEAEKIVKSTSSDGQKVIRAAEKAARKAAEHISARTVKPITAAPAREGVTAARAPSSAFTAVRASSSALAAASAALRPTTTGGTAAAAASSAIVSNPMLLTFALALLVVFLIISGVSLSTVSSSAAAASLTENERAVYNGLKAAGYGDIQIAAVLGNLRQESGCDPSWDEGNAFGIMQWLPEVAKPWFDANGLDYYSIDNQVQYMIYYMPNYWNERINSASYCQGEYAYPETYVMSQEEWAQTTDIAAATGGFCACLEQCSYLPHYVGGTGYNNASMLDEYASQKQSDWNVSLGYGAHDASTENRIAYAKSYLAALTSGGSGGGEAAGIPLDDRMSYLFPNGTPTTQQAMAQYLTEIQVPVCDTAGNISYTAITVHKSIAQAVLSCFEQMAAEGFPIHDVYCYEWRSMASGTGSMSHHSYGVCIDINWDENPAAYWGYSPDTSSPYYINDRIVEIWKSNGFYWGGDWSPSYYDPMHFTYTNH